VASEKNSVIINTWIWNGLRSCKKRLALTFTETNAVKHISGVRNYRIWLAWSSTQYDTE